MEIERFGQQKPIIPADRGGREIDPGPLVDRAQSIRARGAISACVVHGFAQEERALSLEEKWSLPARSTGLASSLCVSNNESHPGLLRLSETSHRNDSHPLERACVHNRFTRQRKLARKVFAEIICKSGSTLAAMPSHLAVPSKIMEEDDMLNSMAAIKTGFIETTAKHRGPNPDSPSITFEARLLSANAAASGNHLPAFHKLIENENAAETAPRKSRIVKLCALKTWPLAALGIVHADGGEIDRLSFRCGEQFGRIDRTQKALVKMCIEPHNGQSGGGFEKTQMKTPESQHPRSAAPRPMREMPKTHNDAESVFKKAAGSSRLPINPVYP